MKITLNREEVEEAVNLWLISKGYLDEEKFVTIDIKIGEIQSAGPFRPGGAYLQCVEVDLP